MANQSRSAAQAEAPKASGQQTPPMQSDYALSQPGTDERADGRYSVAEEQNFDQQSDQARHIGRVDDDAAEQGIKQANRRATPPQ